MSPQHQQQRVTFDEGVKIYLVPVHTEYTREERVALWLGREDFNDIQGDIRKTVKAIRRSSRRSQQSVRPTEDESDVCDRGLEHLRSAAHMEQRKINRDCCMSAVFGEQKRQRSEGCYDEAALADASMDGSRWARDRALEEGMRDAAAVRRLRKREQVRRYQPVDAVSMEIMEQAIQLCDTPVSQSSAPSGDVKRPTNSSAQASLFKDSKALGQMLTSSQTFDKSTRGTPTAKKQGMNPVGSSPHLTTLFARNNTSLAFKSNQTKRRNDTAVNAQ